MVNSRRRLSYFEKLNKKPYAKEIAEIAFFREIKKIAVKFSDDFRTPEAHNFGRVRNFSFSSAPIEDTILINFNFYWDYIYRIMEGLGNSISLDKPIQAVGFSVD